MANHEANGKKAKPDILAQRLRQVLLEALDILDKDGSFGTILSEQGRSEPFRLFAIAKSLGVEIPYKQRDWPNSGVYIVESVGSGRCKIGVATDIRARISTLSTGSPFPLRLVMVFKDLDVSYEKFLHRKLEAYRVNGEWFELPVKEIEALWQTLRTDENQDNG